MTGKIWPRLPFGPAREVFSTLDIHTQPSGSSIEYRHSKAYYAPVGTRVSDSNLRSTREQILSIALDCGFPHQVDDDSREAFDLEVTRRSHEIFPMGWAEAGSTEVWSHLALLPLVDITWWRWQHMKKLNIERFIASDLTRHTWSRLWWRSAQITGDLSILTSLGERNLNQFLERRDATGSSRELISELARELDNHRIAGKRVPHELVREANKMVLRQMSFIDDSALDDEQRASWVKDLVGDAAY